MRRHDSHSASAYPMGSSEEIVRGDLVRRFLDIAGASLLLLLAAPLMLLVIAVLSVTGEREIFFIQPRVGLRQRLFEVFKFATMLKESPRLGPGCVTVPGDPRVLPVGRLLSRWKLNELPQLVNVLRGEMSLVGPRPLTPEVFAYYEPEAQASIASVRPGITGLGSLVFRDEQRILAASLLSFRDCHRFEIAPRKAALEVWYVENRSLALDLRLLCLTAVVVCLPSRGLQERLLAGLPGPQPGDGERV